MMQKKFCQTYIKLSTLPSRQCNRLISCRMEVECETDTCRTGGTRGQRVPRRSGPIPKVEAQLGADVEIHQVRIHSGIYDLQAPEEKEEDNGIILVLPELIAISTDVG